MKVIALVFLVAAISANTKVLTDALECYECEGNECGSNAKTVVCSTDNVATPTPPTTSTREPSTTTLSPTTTLSSTTTTDSTSVGSSSTDAATTTVSDTTSGVEESITSRATEITAEASLVVKDSGSSENVKPATLVVPVPKTINAFLNNLISRKRRDTDTGYACYTLYYTGKNKSEVKKGCVADVIKACDIVADGAKGPLESCELCRNNKCNSSAAIRISIASSVFMLLVFLFK